MLSKLKKFFTKKKIIIILIILVVFFIGKNLLTDSKNKDPEFAVVKKEDIKEELALSGEVDAEEHVVLTFNTSGRVNWIGWKEGEWVKKGQQIASLDTEIMDAVLRQAWQSYTSAKATSDKYYDGRDPNKAESYDDKITRTAIDAAKNVAYDNVRIAQENLKNASLYSPIDGFLVSAEPKVPGVNVTYLNSSYEVVDPSSIYLKITADQTEVGSLKIGKVGEIIFDSYLGETIKGKISDISFVPAKDEIGTVYAVKIKLIDVDNNDYKYRLGMTADINFTLKESKNALVIPSQHIKIDGNKKYVLVGRDKKKTYIKTGVENDQYSEVKEGLSEGDKVYD